MPITRNYWWIVARDAKGAPSLIFGSDISEDDARQKGFEMLPGLDFNIKKYPTRNLQSASSMYRGTRLQSTHSIYEANRRIGHEKSIKRARRKRDKGEKKSGT